MPSSAMGISRGAPASPAQVMGELAALNGQLERVESDLAVIIAASPGLKVCLVERFAPGEMMLWVGPGLWQKLHELTAAQGERADAQS